MIRRGGVLGLGVGSCYRGWSETGNAYVLVPARTISFLVVSSCDMLLNVLKASSIYLGGRPVKYSL